MIMFIICITPRAKHTNYLTRLPDESMKRAAPSDEGGVTLRGERATAGVLGGGSTGPERGRLAAGPASPHSLQLRRQAGEGRQVRTPGGRRGVRGSVRPVGTRLGRDSAGRQDREEERVRPRGPWTARSALSSITAGRRAQPEGPSSRDEEDPVTSCPPTYIAFPSDMREPVSSLYTVTALDSKKKKKQK